MKKIISLVMLLALTASLLFTLSACGKKASVGLEFQSNGDGTCTWIGLGSCTDTEIIVPEKNGDNTVVSVGKEIIRNNEGITKITLPDTVKILEDFAFAYNDSILEIDFGKGLETIGESAVAYCRNLKKASLPNGLKTIEKGAFTSDEALEEIIIPESIEFVGTSAFSFTKSVKKISIPSTMNEFHSTDFCADSLEELEIKGEMKYFNLSLSGEDNFYGGLCKDPQKTDSAMFYKSICTEENITTVICTLFNKESIKFNGKVISPSTELMAGTYLKEENSYSFEITESKELVVLFGLREKVEIARLSLQLNEETNRYTTDGTGTYLDSTYKIDASLISFDNSIHINMDIDGINNTDSFSIHGLWQLS